MVHCRRFSVATILPSVSPTHPGYRNLFQRRCPLMCRWATHTFPPRTVGDPIAKGCSLRRHAFHLPQSVRGFSYACLWISTFLFYLARVLSSLLTSCSDFVLDLASNGELQSRISRMGSLSTACARYYTAQLVDALDYMHLRGVIHRCARVALSQVSTLLIPLPAISNRKTCC